MLKKVFMTVVLCIGLVAVWGLQEAKAWPRPANWGLKPGSVVCEALWKGAGNTTKDDSTLDVTCNLSWIKLEGSCQNFGGGTGGEGNPFSKIIEGTSNTITLDGSNIDGKGQADSKNYFSDCDFYDLIKERDDLCVNPNWSVIPPKDCVEPEPEVVGSLLVTATYVCIEIYDVDTDFSYVEGYCTLEFDPVESKYYYYCDEWGSGRAASCPLPPETNPAFLYD